jgi:hypothetical protein
LQGLLDEILALEATLGRLRLLVGVLSDSVASRVSGVKRSKLSGSSTSLAGEGDGDWNLKGTILRRYLVMALGGSVSYLRE